MTDYLMEFFETYIIPVLLVLIILCSIGLFLFIPFVIYECVFVKHEYVKLRVDKWSCTRTVVRQHTSMIISGKVTVPIITWSTDCIQYSEK